MHYYLLPKVEDELLTALLDASKTEEHSFQRIELIFEKITQYPYLSLLQSQTLVELGVDGNLSALHFEMERTRGHILGTRIMPDELLLLSFYKNKSDLVTPELAEEANRRLLAYWSRI